MERTLVIIKPDAMGKRLVGRIISIYEANRLDIIHAHRVVATREVLEQHYEALKGKPFFEELLQYMMSSPIEVLVLEGENVVSIVREINGATDPSQARPGTIRYMYGIDKGSNAVHGSESVEAGLREINIWKNLIRFEAE